ncbi:MAG: transglycosylase SLT domain-containing protein [Gemmatimonadetes bacterium]|nr:lytic transglycosylase domain-containing protein [Gemmatimonadota bacterium]NIQ58185.1 lytic transglycosylase domain-containing protein [Gemmatimonadota bacterium]NIU78391.1 transglycosylase SLT domain-containing protein [Gammaproteobacteria bacterium]NIX47321.1 transglycosylase SLT domain-containing protein [Gemmatimonadota bacterium]NIY11701.1 transglycosylase SLT domain-containing protein [Gemmatimonadota bacterium]
MTEPDSARGPSRTQLLRELARQAEARGLVAHHGRRGRGRRRSDGRPLSQWELQERWRRRRRAAALWDRVRTPLRLTGAVAIAFVVGLQLAARPENSRLATLETEAEQSRIALRARQGELELVRLEMNRLQEIMEYSSRYSIPADLATAINDIALAEGIAPDLAFQLVKVESGFYRRAISPKGAVGYAQLMPPTAFELDPSLEYRDLFDRETNLRLGFRYLRWLIDRYDGDLRTALLAYNRGLGTVDSIRREGGDPANGYARAILEGTR